MRARTLLVLTAAIAVPAWLWQRADPQQLVSPGSANAVKTPIAATAPGTGGRTPPAASTSADAAKVLAPQSAPSASDRTASSGAAVPTLRSVPLRLDVRAPSSARVGERVTVTIDAEAFSAIRSLSFAVIYDREMLEFYSSSPGPFVQQASAPASLSAEDPSSGNVLVHMKVQNDGAVAAAGTVVVLEFNTLRAGSSPIALRDVSYRETGHEGSSSSAALRLASIKIEGE